MRRALRYAAFASAVAVASAASLLPLALGQDARLLWGGLGWAPMALIGVLGGAWLAAEHGQPHGGFFVALFAGMLARLLVGAGGAALAAWSGGEATPAYLAGMTAGFAPLLVFEAAWFGTITRRESARA